MKKNNLGPLLAVLVGFFVMGFVDIVTTATSYVQKDLRLSDTVAKMLPLAVFLWFALISIPTGSLMGRIGRKKTVLLSYAVTTVGMILPVVSYTLPVVMTAFALLGIGNTILQVSLNPLLMDVVPQERLTSNLTLGQFIKAICSTLGPIILAGASAYLENWKLVFPLYAVITILSFVWLSVTALRDEAKTTSVGNVWSLFRDGRIMLFFSVIVLIVGYEIGLVSTIPNYLEERCGCTIEQGSFANFLYYTARTLGTFLGAIILARVSAKRFFVLSMCIAVAAFVGIMATPGVWVIYASLFIVGLACASVFAIVFGMAMQHNPQKANQISALMITGVAGGALIPPVMGVIADRSSQLTSLVVPLLCLGYILFVSILIANRKK